MSNKAELAKIHHELADEFARVIDANNDKGVDVLAGLLIAAFRKYDQAATALSAEGGTSYGGGSGGGSMIGRRAPCCICGAPSEAALSTNPDAPYCSRHLREVEASVSTPIPQAPGEEGLREILAQEYDRDEEPSHEAEMIRKGDFDFQDGVYMKIALAAMRRVASYSDDLILPTNADEAELMEKVGYEYLQQHAPERLRQPSADLVAAAKAEMECGWLIELGASEISRPRYWGGVHGWTYDNLKAVRFAREEDARSIAESMDDGFPNNYRVKEHGWG